MMNSLFEDSLLEEDFSTLVGGTLAKYPELAMELRGNLRMRSLASEDDKKGLSLIAFHAFCWLFYGVGFLHRSV